MVELQKKLLKDGKNLKIFQNLFLVNLICLSSNKETKKFLKKFGAKKIKFFGNLKFSQSKNEKIK